MDLMPESPNGYVANQFWIATRMLEALTFLFGLLVIKKRGRLNSDLIFLCYLFISLLIIFSILVWYIFPVCYIEGVGQTPFKIYSEYIIITILILSGVLLHRHRKYFSQTVYRFLIFSIVFTVLSEFCFTLYISNFSTANEVGHYAKLISFFLVYKANVETSFIRPTDVIFKNLKDSEEKYRTLAENLPGIVLRFDNDLNCIYSNHASLAQHTGDDQNQFIKMQHQLMGMLSPVLDRTKKTGSMQNANLKLGAATDSRFYVAQVIPEYSENDEETIFLVICQDVTEIKQTEQQLQALNDTKDKLFSIIAHDLKTPFTSLLTYSELISGKAESLERVKIAHMASRMNDSAKQAYRLLENLLTWSTVQTGLLKPVKKGFQVAELFEEVRQLTAATAQSKGIDLQFECKEDIAVFADRQMTATILRNLVSNSLKFSFKESTVAINAIEEGNDIRFSIKDEGTGISAEHKKHLLEIGNKLSSQGTAAEVGTGLGLVLCREFVEVNDGNIWFESELGAGTTFYFTLPVG